MLSSSSSNFQAIFWALEEIDIEESARETLREFPALGCHSGGVLISGPVLNGELSCTLTFLDDASFEFLGSDASPITTSSCVINNMYGI